MNSNLELPQSWYEQSPITLAQDLLGKILIVKKNSQTKACLITETEAYLGKKDKASHARFGKTKRSKIMWKKGGYIYVYIVYGIHYLLNFVALPKNKPGAVLIRGADPIQNIKNNISGPGKLTKELGINLKDNNTHINSNESIFLHDFSIKFSNIIKKPRIGIDYAGQWANKPFRYLVKPTPSQLNQAERKFSTIDY